MGNKGKANDKITGIICAVFFIFLAVMLCIIDKDVLADNATDLYELIDNNEELKSQYVELYVDGVIGNYAETEHRINGIIPSGTDQHYLLWLDDGTFISLTTRNKDLMSKLDAICDNTWYYIDYKTDVLDKSITIKGKIGSMDTEIKGFCNEWLDELEVSHSDMRYVSINADTSRGSVLGYVGICLLLAAVGVVVFIFAVKKEKNDAFNAQLVNSYQAMNSNSEFDQMADNTTHDAGSGIDKDTFM